MENHAIFDRKIKKILITEDEIKEKTQKAGKEISEEYAGKPLLLISILKGAFVFMADICRCISIPCEIDFMSASSYYNGTHSSGNVKIALDLSHDISKYHVIIIEDIVDSGRTLMNVVKVLKERNPLSLKVLALLDKPARREVDFKPDEVLFEIPDYFVVGYGLDCGELYRNLPYIAEYNPDIIV